MKRAVILILFIGTTGLASSQALERFQTLLGQYQSILSQQYLEKDKYDLLIGQKFGASQLYRLFLDQLDQAPEDELIFDRDESPGYAQAMKKAFFRLRSHLESEFDFDELVAFHDATVRGVSRRNRAALQKGIGVRWAYEIEQVQFEDRKGRDFRITQEAMRDWEREKLIYRDVDGKKRKGKKPSDYLATLFSPDHSKPNIFKVASNLIYLGADSPFLNSPPKYNYYMNFLNSDGYEDLVKAARTKLYPYFKRYHDTIPLAQDIDDKLMAIARLLRAIHIFHMFPDGNGRTMILSRTKLLIQNDLPPAILDDSAVFGGYKGTLELVKELKIGIWNYFAAIHELPPLSDDIRNEIIYGIALSKPQLKEGEDAPSSGWVGFLFNIFR